LYLQPELLVHELPTLRWLTRTQEQVAVAANAILEPLRAALAPRYTVTLEPMLSQIGSGSLPIDRLPSCGLAIAPVLSGKRGMGTALDALSDAMRGLPAPIIGRIAEDRVLLDCRCVDDPGEVINQLAGLRLAIIGDSA
jgi:L-seryl-tRNA(Ser) seleniumtransferase